MKVIDTQTGKENVIAKSRVPEITGGTYSGVKKAMKDGRVYKKRYRMRYVEEGEKTRSVS